MKYVKILLFIFGRICVKFVINIGLKFLRNPNFQIITKSNSCCKYKFELLRICLYISKQCSR